MWPCSLSASKERPPKMLGTGVQPSCRGGAAEPQTASVCILCPCLSFLGGVRSPRNYLFISNFFIHSSIVIGRELLPHLGKKTAGLFQKKQEGGPELSNVGLPSFAPLPTSTPPLPSPSWSCQWHSTSWHPQETHQDPKWDRAPASRWVELGPGSYPCTFYHLAFVAEASLRKPMLSAAKVVIT